jgi:F-type H+-transporting ATPase subunit delta
MAVLGGSVARRYARALFEIGADRGTFEAFGVELERLAEVYEGSPELRQALENPVFQLAQRRRVLERILPQLAPSLDVQKFAYLLLERRRIGLLPRIAECARRSRRPRRSTPPRSRASSAPSSGARARRCSSRPRSTRR